VQTDFDEKAQNPSLKFKFVKDDETRKELEKLFDRSDENKDGKLNFQECKNFY